MALGQFGSTTADSLRFSAGGRTGGGANGSLIDQAIERLTPSPSSGNPAQSDQLAQSLAGYGVNLCPMGSFEDLDVGATLAGTVSSSGTTVTGSGTAFLTDFANNDLLIVCDATTGETRLRRVTARASDTSLTIASAFSSDIGAGSLHAQCNRPLGWNLAGTGAYYGRDTTNVQEGLASALITVPNTTAVSLHKTVLTISSTQNTRFRGRRVTLSARVLSSLASRLTLRLDDGVLTLDSRAHVGDGTFELLSVTMTLDAAATKIKVSAECSSGDNTTFNVDALKLEEGATATTFTLHPHDQFGRTRRNQDTSTDTATTVYEELTNMNVLGVVTDGA